MYKSILPVVVIIEALILTTPAEAVITFERTYGGADWDEGNSVQETQGGGFIIAGNTFSFGDGSSNCFTRSEECFLYLTPYVNIRIHQ